MMKTTHWRLAVTLSRSPRQLSADRKLKRLVQGVGLRHGNRADALEAAALISGSGALVMAVTVTRVTEEPEGVWQRGKRV